MFIRIAYGAWLIGLPFAIVGANDASDGYLRTLVIAMTTFVVIKLGTRLLARRRPTPGATELLREAQQQLVPARVISIVALSVWIAIGVSISWTHSNDVDAIRYAALLWMLLPVILKPLVLQYHAIPALRVQARCPPPLPPRVD